MRPKRKLGIRVGTWTPGLPRHTQYIMLYILIILLTIRGFDYVLLKETTSHLNRLSIAEQFMDIHAWGLLCIAMSVILAFGVIFRRYRIIIVASSLTGILYTALSIGAFYEVVSLGYPWDGFRAPFNILGYGLLWMAIAWGTSVMRKAKPSIYGGLENGDMVRDNPER